MRIKFAILLIGLLVLSLTVANQTWFIASAEFENQTNNLAEFTGAKVIPVLVPLIGFCIVATVIGLLSKQLLFRMALASTSIFCLMAAAWILLSNVADSPEIRANLQRLQLVVAAHGDSKIALATQPMAYLTMAVLVCASGLAIWLAFWPSRGFVVRKSRQAKIASSSAIDLWEGQRP